ncbi:hypothetical protein LXA43DRAFT_1067044 [Ganoderma leucocontextum]|nr:hypothetical protein LXA43DRAFT_1067044 [Ganoderma leucocontextum]
MSIASPSSIGPHFFPLLRLGVQGPSGCFKSLTYTVSLIMLCGSRNTTRTAAPDRLAISNQIVCPQGSDDSAVVDSEDPLDLCAPPLGEDTDDMSRIARAVQAVTASSMFEPVFPTTSAEPAMLAAAAPQDLSTATTPQFSVDEFRGESMDGINGGPGLASSRCKGNRWIRYILASGLVIEVEATGSNGRAESEAKLATQPTAHSPIIVRPSSPETPHGHDSHLQSDDSAIYAYTYPEESDTYPCRQVGDYYFELEELQSQFKPFHQGDLWRLEFIPTLLKFLGTRSNPWDLSGDSFIYLLRHVWTTVYGEPSWSDEDSDLVRALATESVTAWFDSFGSNALAAVESFLRRLTGGFSSFSEWSVLCKEMMRDCRMFYEYPDGPHSRGIYCSVFILAPLSRHMEAIRGGTDVQGLRAYYPYYESAFPFGAIGLAAAAAFRAMLLFRTQSLGYDEGGNLVIKTPTNGGAELRTIDTSFSQHTAEGRTRHQLQWWTITVSSLPDTLVRERRALHSSDDGDS